VGSSMGLWEVMLAMSKAQKQKRDTEAAATKTAWERDQDTQKLELERQRIAVQNRAYEQAKPETPAQVSEREARAAAARARAAKDATAKELLGPRQEAELKRINAQAGNLDERTVTERATRPLTLQLKGVQIGALNQRQARDEVETSYVPELRTAQIDRLERQPAGAGGAGGVLGGTTRPPSDDEMFRWQLQAEIDAAKTAESRIYSEIETLKKTGAWKAMPVEQRKALLDMHASALQMLKDLPKKYATRVLERSGKKPASPDNAPPLAPPSDQPAKNVADEWFENFRQRAAGLAPEQVEIARQKTLKLINEWKGDFATWGDAERRRLLKLMGGVR
jgi:hypothetical protein